MADQVSYVEEALMSPYGASPGSMPAIDGRDLLRLMEAAEKELMKRNSARMTLWPDFKTIMLMGELVDGI